VLARQLEQKWRSVLAYEPERQDVTQEDTPPAGPPETTAEGAPVVRREVVEESGVPPERRVTEEVQRQPVERRTTQVTEQQRCNDQEVADRRYQLRRTTEAIYAAFAVLEVLIAFRVVLKLLAANPANLFAEFIYGVTAPFVFPFQGLFVTPSSGGFVLELSSIVAIFVYMLIAYALVRLVWLLFDIPRTCEPL
jgi:YggT family protein